jgi:agmatine/peptidylarginine deiminase
MNPNDIVDDPEFQRYAALVEEFANAPNIKEVEHLRDLLDQLLKLQAQEALLNWQRLQPWMSAGEERPGDATYLNREATHALWRRVRAAGNRLTADFRSGALALFGPLGMEMNDYEDKLRPDFAPVRQLVLAYPEGVSGEGSDYNGLTGFYDELLGKVPPELEVVLLVKSRAVAQRLRPRQLHPRLRYVVQTDLQTIWLRDAVGFNCGPRLVKPRYSPLAIGDSMALVPALLGMDVERLPLWWDGGNLVSNGRVALVGDLMLKHNGAADDPRKQEQIAQDIRQALGVEVVEWVALPRADKLGHTDGYAAFVGESRAVVGTYPQEWEPDQRCADELAERLRAHGMEVTRLPESPTGKSGNSSLGSAEGIYVNFLQLNSTWLVPTYGLDGDEAALDCLRRLNPHGQVVPVNCTRLAEFGGVLHCISFTN